MRLVENLVEGLQRADVGCNGAVDTAGITVILTREEGQTTVSSFEAEDRAERRGNADTATAVTSQRKWDDSSSDSVRGSRRTTTSVVVLVVWIPWRAVEDVIPRCIYHCQSYKWKT